MNNRSPRRRAARFGKVHVLLYAAILLSALLVVNVRHQNRLAFVDWRGAQNAKTEMQFENGRLLLEKATWARRRNIVSDARARLGMNAPRADEIVTLELNRQQPGARQ